MQLTIEKLVYGGDGLARLPGDPRGPGKTVFLPFVLEGETVEATIVDEKPGFARARVEKILHRSPKRVEPGCPYFQRCGGCHYQHASYEHQLEIKSAILKETLRRIAKVDIGSDLKIHASPPWKYRNRTRLKLRTSPQFALGYYRVNSHELLPVEECPISSPLLNRAIAALWQVGRTGQFTAGEGDQRIESLEAEIEFFATADDTKLLVEFYCPAATPRRVARAIGEQLASALPESLGIVVFRTERKNGEPEQLVKIGADNICYQTKRASFRVSAGAFFQVNRYLVDDLVDVVVTGQSGANALDLYAGGGLFATALSLQFKNVIAVEASPLSCGDLEYNSPENVKAVQALAGQYLKTVTGKLQPDLVVVDPPRGGLGKTVVHSLVGLGAPRITYVSCDPATLSRDLGRLFETGYRIERAHLIDLFPQTYHLESVFHLVR